MECDLYCIIGSVDEGFSPRDRGSVTCTVSSLVWRRSSGPGTAAVARQSNELPAAAGSVLRSLQEGEPQDRHVVIVDDLVQSGGTLIECHSLLSSLGAKHGEQQGPPRAPGMQLTEQDALSCS
jgi:hypothetical protein